MFIRIFFVLLVIAQIVLLVGYFPQISTAVGYRAADPAIPPQETSIRLAAVSGVEAPLSIEVITNRVSGQTCREIGNFAEKKSAEGVRRWLEARGVGGRIDTRVNISDQTYRVYLGEFADEEEATFAQRIIQKRNPDLRDAFIYQTNSKWRVSLAQFAEKTGAETFRGKLEQGVEGLRVFIESRQITKTSSSLRYVGEDAERLILLSKKDADLVQQLGANTASIKDCS